MKHRTTYLLSHIHRHMEILLFTLYTPTKIKSFARVGALPSFLQPGESHPHSSPVRKCQYFSSKLGCQIVPEKNFVNHVYTGFITQSHLDQQSVLQGEDQQGMGGEMCVAQQGSKRFFPKARVKIKFQLVICNSLLGCKLRLTTR